MRLKSVHITNFKSIRDSNRFDVAGVTCVVGKNESGKTAILQALYRLNPVVPEHGSFDVTEDYPRAIVEEYRQKVEADAGRHEVVVRAEFEIEARELGPIEAEFGGGVLKSPIIELSKGYSDRLYVDLKVDEEVAVRSQVESAGLPADVEADALKHSSLKGLVAFLNSRAETQARAFALAQAQANALTDEAAKSKALAESHDLAESAAARSLRERLAAIDTEQFSIYLWTRHLRATFPKFLYFDEYYQMTGEVNIEQLRERKKGTLLDSDRPMIGLIGIARLSLDQLITPGKTEDLVSKLEGASNHLSRQILKYWSQTQHLHVRFDVRPAQPGDPEGMRSGTNLWGRVYDSVHEVSTRLGTRSRGFLWFFSFLAWFSQRRCCMKQEVARTGRP